MNIFVVEDNDNIRSDIVDVIKEVYPLASITESGEYAKAKESLEKNKVDVLIVDLCLSGEGSSYKWEGRDIAKSAVEKTQQPPAQSRWVEIAD